MIDALSFVGSIDSTGAGKWNGGLLMGGKMNHLATAVDKSRMDRRFKQPDLKAPSSTGECIMRFIVLALLATFVFAGEARANSVSVPSNGTVTIVGNYAGYDQQQCNGCNGIPAQLSFSFTGGDYIGPPNPDPINGPFYGFLISVFANGTAQEHVCAFSQLGSSCGRAFQYEPNLWIYNDGLNNEGVVFISTSIEPVGDISPITVSVFLDLPAGFSIAAVPESSTWAMLLIGFAGIGFAARRRQIASRNA